MTINMNIKILLAVVLLSGSSCFATVKSDDTKPVAPEASAAEIKLEFRDVPLLETGFIDAAPANRKDAIQVGKLGHDGGSKGAIVKLAKEMAAGQHGKFDSLLIAHKDKLLFESYYLRGRINLPHPQASAVKGITSLILGRAIQLGYLTMDDLDKPLVGFLKDLDPAKFVDGADQITLHQAMTMRSGIRLSEEIRKELEENPARLTGQRQVQTWLELSEPITAESQSYLYQGTDPDMVMQVIDAVVPGTAEDFIKTELLDKMGISNYSWQTGPSGLPEAGWMVSFTSRDMLKWGSLVTNEGQWQGEQLIPADYLDKATSGLVKPTQDWMPEDYRYGYFWYQTNMSVGDKTYDARFAWGGGGQRIITVAALDLTIVVTATEREDTIMTQVSDVILPAFVE